MRKTKILLPIMGLGATAAAVTPLLVSCGSSLIDGNSVIIPTIKQADEDSLNHNQTNTLYVEHIIANPEIFVQDWLYDISWKARAIKFTQREFNKPEPTIMMNAKFSNIQAKKAVFKRTTTQQDWNGMLLSYDLEATIRCDGNGSFIEMPYKLETQGEVAGLLLEKMNLKFKSTITNCPFIVDWHEKTDTVVKRSGWRNWFNSGYRDQAPNWQVKINVDGLYIGTAENEHYEYKNEEYVFNAQNDLPLGNPATKTAYMWSTYDNLFGSMDYVYHLQLIY